MLQDSTIHEKKTITQQEEREPPSVSGALLQHSAVFAYTYNIHSDFLRNISTFLINKNWKYLFFFALNIYFFKLLFFTFYISVWWHCSPLFSNTQAKKAHSMQSWKTPLWSNSGSGAVALYLTTMRRNNPNERREKCELNIFPLTNEVFRSTRRAMQRVRRHDITCEIHIECARRWFPFAIQSRFEVFMVYAVHVIFHHRNDLLLRSSLPIYTRRQSRSILMICAFKLSNLLLVGFFCVFIICESK